MSTTEIKIDYTVAQEIFRQLSVSKINGFPFIMYSGIKAKVIGQNSITFTAPKNPARIKTIHIQYVEGTDTYIVSYYRGLGTFIKEVDDIYCDVLARNIAREMKII